MALKAAHELRRASSLLGITGVAIAALHLEMAIANGLPKGDLDLLVESVEDTLAPFIKDLERELAR